MCRAEPSDCEATIASASAELQATRMPWYWQVGPHCTRGLQQGLAESGFVASHDVPAMAADLTQMQRSQASQDFTVKRVECEAHLDDWVDVGVRAFALPESVGKLFRTSLLDIGFLEVVPVRHFVGYSSGEPVATGTVFYGAGVAGIFCIGTVSEARGRGFGTEMTRACMRDARDRSHSVAILHASRMGYPVYVKLGFEEICRLESIVPAS
jgi:ribosomal protein S18 acetylase RimI-like enzyme